MTAHPASAASLPPPAPVRLPRRWRWASLSSQKPYPVFPKHLVFKSNCFGSLVQPGMALQDKVAIVTGATGIVGEGIARAFLDAGATLICPIRRRAAAASRLLQTAALEAGLWEGRERSQRDDAVSSAHGSVGKYP